MLFNRKEYRFCANCARSAALGDGQLLCPRKGVVSENRCCSAFQYDPLKRKPARPIQLPHPTDADFTL